MKEVLKSNGKSNSKLDKGGLVTPLDNETFLPFNCEPDGTEC